MTEVAIGKGAKGLTFIEIDNDQLISPLKFLTQSERQNIVDLFDGKKGNTVFLILADTEKQAEDTRIWLTSRLFSFELNEVINEIMNITKRR